MEMYEFKIESNSNKEEFLLNENGIYLSTYEDYDILTQNFRPLSNEKRRDIHSSFS